MDKTETFGVLLIIMGTLLVLHHICLWQRPFDIEDILHHEFFEAVFLTAGITLLASTHCKKKKRIK